MRRYRAQERELLVGIAVNFISLLCLKLGGAWGVANLGFQRHISLVDSRQLLGRAQKKILTEWSDQNMSRGDHIFMVLLLESEIQCANMIKYY